MTEKRTTLQRAAMLAASTALAACGGGGSGGGSDPPSAPSAAPTAAPSVALLPPSGTIYLGAFVNTSATSPPLESDEVALETSIGRKLALSLHYYGFTEDFPGAYEQADEQNGRMPIDSWNCAVPDAAVAAGQQDAVIKRRADAIRAFGKPILLRYMWEMNAPSSATYRSACYDPATDEAGGYFSPTEFTAAWAHIRAIFSAEGASNVVWLWNVTGGSNGPSYYPGASLVDWVGLDQYEPGGVSVSGTFSGPYDQLAGFAKPILVAETGVAAADQPSYFPQVANVLQTHFPLVAGYVYFDSNGTDQDWRLTPSGLGAFGSMAAQPYFAASPPP